MNGDKRYHAEVKILIEGHEARVNCFADTLVEIFQDIGTICGQFPPDWKSPAKREAMNEQNAQKRTEAQRQEAEAREKARVQRKTAAQEAQAKAASKAMPKAPFGQIEKAITKAYKDSGIPENDDRLDDMLFGEETGEIPVCPNCGTNEAMELIEWRDKQTGKPRAEWKCQQCHKWLPKPKNGRGR